MIRILVVDDSRTILNFLRALFESEHYEVTTAEDGADGLARVRQFRPDLVVTDSIMPGLDGFAFLAGLRGDPDTAGIPVIMLTSSDPGSTEFAQRMPRPDAFVKKSADFGPLLAEVQAVLRGRVPST